ncbi:MAG: TPM domain-containing protein [Candidatus Goldbacteria bacterium]|nr:TPM domain-containing protein [Candidatus Goldiibacteriota bacterium]
MDIINNTNEILNPNELKLIIETIKNIEIKTTGKIRVYVGKKIRGEPMSFARNIFKQFGLNRLVDKNGVLFIITVKDKKLIVFGDDGINSKVDKTFWINVKNALITKFKNGQFFTGLMGGINLVGEKLMEFFMRDFEDLSGVNNDDKSIFFEE